jgi:hypothetical protein
MQSNTNSATWESAESTCRISGVIVGLFLGLDQDGKALVDYPDNPTGAALRARTTGSVAPSDRGREAALLFEGGDPCKPILVGLIQDRTGKHQKLQTEIDDDETVELTAQKQIVLRCGDASITLTRSGKILIRGKYVLSSSSGANIVKGGIIRLN